MALFTWPFPKNPSAPPLLGVMALAVAAAAVILLAVGLFNLQVNLETRQVELEVRTAQAQSVASDKAALVALYNATAGSSWTNNTNWDSDEPLGDWRGVAVDANGRVTSLTLNANNLTGTLPADLGNLSRLQALSLHDNNLSGSIPTELGSLSDLTSLLLYNNSLSGTIPAELGDLSNLTNLNLGSNSLTGTIPTELGSLNSLSMLLLHSNSLDGSIPAELGNLNSLTRLGLNSNSLTGTIPAQLGRLSSLTVLQIYANSLTGAVPAELCDLSSLTLLEIRDNQLTWELPACLTGISGMNTVAFQNNDGLCAPLENPFQTWFDAVPHTSGSDCPPTRIWSGATVPVVGEPIFVELTNQEHRLARINATQAEYDADPCIGYDDTRGIDNGWSWEWSTSQGGPWGIAIPGKHPDRATFIYVPQSGDVGRWFRAEVTHGGTTITTEPIGPVVAAHNVASGDQVSVDAPAGTVQVDNDLSVSLSADDEAERRDTAINPRPGPWQWEQSDDGSSDWSNVTPFHKHCEAAPSQYSLTTEDDGKHLRSYIYYNDDSSGSAVLKRGQSASVGPVVP